MEPVTAPLRLISRKFLKPLADQKTRRKCLSKKWLEPTLDRKQAVLPAYRPMLVSLYDLKYREIAIKDFRHALKMKEYSYANSLWQKVLGLEKKSEDVVENMADEILGGNKLVSKLTSWNSLNAVSSSYGPPSFVNALNDIARHNRQSPSILHQLVSPSKSPLDPYILGYVISKLGNWNEHELSIDLLSKPDWTNEAKILGWTALLYSAECNPVIIATLFREASPPTGYKLPGFLVSQLANCSINVELVNILRLFINHDMLSFTKPLDQLLRRVYTSSDLGSQLVREYACDTQLPWTFYPFLVRRLCEAEALGDQQAKEQLDQLFDHQIASLATSKPSLVLHLLVMRIIATNGVQATSPVLNRWVESDSNGVSEQTWLLLFQAFRRMGRPDKCNEVLGRVLKQHVKLSLPMIGEYLVYTAQFHNLHEYLARLLRVIPEIEPVLKELGIIDYAMELPIPPPLVLQPSNHVLTPENRDFYVRRIHESWLDITYPAVLSSVETTEVALALFDKYMHYAVNFSSAPVSHRVLDQFVELICGLPGHNIDCAEQIYRRGLQELRFKRPSDGKNHSKSLELLCYQLLRGNNVDKAIQLLVDASTDHGAVIRKTTIEPWIKKLPQNIQERLLDWVHDHAGVVLEKQKR